MRYIRSRSILEENSYIAPDLSENYHHMVQEPKEMTMPKMAWALNSVIDAETAEEDVDDHMLDEVLIADFLVLFSLESVAE